MSDDSSSEEDSVSNIDFSVISRAIEASGKMIQQILNGIHYGTPEVRDLLYNQAEFIVECRVCRNLFRSIPNFVAHKRIYCSQSAFVGSDESFGLPCTQEREETIVVEPQSVSPEPSTSNSTSELSSGVHNENQGVLVNQEEYETISVEPSGGEIGKQGEETGTESTLQQLLTGTFKGKSSAYNLYTKLAKRAEARKSSTTTSIITMTPISTNRNAAFINMTNSVHSETRPVIGQKQNSTDSEKNMETDNRKSNNVSAAEKIVKESDNCDQISKTVYSGKSALQRKLEQKNKQHVELRPVKSPVGSQQFKELMELGLLGHCDLSRYTCAICATKYSSRKSLLQHMHAKHSGRKLKFPCTICSKTFSYLWGVTRHLQQNHRKSKIQIEKLRPIIKAKAFECIEEEEEEKNDDESGSSSVQETEKKISKMQNVQSNSGQSTKSNFGKTPSGIKLNKCDGCGKAFWKLSNYDQHIEQCKWLRPASTVSKMSPNKSMPNGKNILRTTRMEGNSTRTCDRNDIIATTKVPDEEKDVSADDSKVDDSQSARQNEYCTRSSASTVVSECVSDSRTRSNSQEPRDLVQDRHVPGKSLAKESNHSSRLRKDGKTDKGTSDLSAVTNTAHTSDHEHQTRSKDTNTKNLNCNKTENVKHSLSRSIALPVEHKTKSQTREDTAVKTPIEDSSSDKQSLSSEVTEHQTRSRTKDKTELMTSEPCQLQTRSNSKDKTDTRDLSTQRLMETQTSNEPLVEMSELEKRLQSNDKNHLSSSDEKIEGEKVVSAEVRVTESEHYTRSQTKTGKKLSYLAIEHEKPILECATSDQTTSSQMENDDKEIDRPEKHKASSSSGCPDRDKQIVMLPVKPMFNIVNVVKNVQSQEQNSAVKSGFVPRYVVLDKTNAKEFNELADMESDEEKEKEIEDGNISNNALDNSVDSKEKTETSKVIDSRNSKTDQTSKTSPGSPKKGNISTSDKQSPTRGQSTPSSLHMRTRRLAAMDKESKYMRTRFFEKRRESHLPSRTEKSSPQDTKGDKQKNRQSDTRDSSVESKRSCDVSPSPSKTESVDGFESSQERITRRRNHSDSSRESSRDRSGTTYSESGNERSGSRKQKFLSRLDNSQSKESLTSSSNVMRTRSNSHSGSRSDKRSLQAKSHPSDTKDNMVDTNKKSDDVKGKGDTRSLENKSQEAKVCTRRSAITEAESSNSLTADGTKSKVDTALSAADRISARKSINKGESNQLSTNRVQTRGGHKLSDTSAENLRKDVPVTETGSKIKSSNRSDTSRKVKQGGLNQTSPEKKSSRLKQKQDTKKNDAIEETDSSYIISENVLDQFMTDEVDGNICITDRKASEIKDKIPNTKLDSLYQIKKPVDKSFLGMEVSPHTKDGLVTDQGTLRQYKIKVQGPNPESTVAMPCGTGEKESMPNTRNANKQLKQGIQNKTVLSIQEIWVQKEPGQPTEEVCTNKILVTEDNTPTPVRPQPTSSQTRSSERIRSNRMYVVDPKEASHARCLDFNRVERLSDEVACKCLQCDMSFKCVANLRRHVVRHLGWRRYKCKLCKFTSYMKSECNTHLIRSHADKLLSCSLGSMIIDLNKEASRVRSQKKQKTIQEKQEEGAKSMKVKTGSSWSKYFRGRTTRFNSIRTAPTHQQKVGVKRQPVEERISTRSRSGQEKDNRLVEDGSQSVSEGSDDLVRTLRRRKVPRSADNVNSEKIVAKRKLPAQDLEDQDNQEKEVSKIRKSVQAKKRIEDKDKKTEGTVDIESARETRSSVSEERKLRKRKRSNSEDGTNQKVQAEKEEVNRTAEIDTDLGAALPPPETRMKRSVSLDGGMATAGAQESLNENLSESFEIPSVSDYENSDSEIISSPPVSKIAPNLNTMMTALEEARAFVRRRSRGRRISTPCRKIQRLNSAGISGYAKDSASRLSVDSATCNKTDDAEIQEDSNLGSDETNSEKVSSEKGEFCEFEISDIVLEKGSECLAEISDSVLQDSPSLKSHSAKPSDQLVCVSNQMVKDSSSVEIKILKEDKISVENECSEQYSCPQKQPDSTETGDKELKSERPDNIVNESGEESTGATTANCVREKAEDTKSI